MRSVIAVLQVVVQTIQETAPPGGQPGGPGGPRGPGGPPPAFEIVPAFFELLRFVGSFLAIGAVGFRFGIVRQIRGMSDEAKAMLRADNAAMLGIAGIILIAYQLSAGRISIRSRITRRSPNRCPGTCRNSNSR